VKLRLVSANLANAIGTTARDRWLDRTIAELTV